MDKSSNEPGILIVVAAALVDGDGRVLVQQRPAGRPMAGLWEFPGGKCAPGERLAESLIRELAEELGIATDTSCLAPAAFADDEIDGRGLLLLLYVCRKWRGIPRGCEGQALKWVRPVDMHVLDMPPADRPLIGLIEQLL